MLKYFRTIRKKLIEQDNVRKYLLYAIGEILQPFFTTKKGTQGTGLELSITHDIIKAHGRRLEIESSHNESATFIIYLEKKG